jgi:hypothetical protein
MGLLAPVLAIAALLVGYTLVRYRDAAARTSGFRRAGLWWTVAFGIFASLFVAGETVDDPGGWEAVGLIVAWAVPMVVLSVLALWRPRVALQVLAAAILVGLVLAGWGSIGHASGREGPVGPIALFAASVAVGLLGRHLLLPAGLLLLVVGVLPGVFEVLGSSAPWRHALTGSTGAATLPALVPAVLYLCGAWFERRAAPPPTSSPRQPDRPLVSTH